MMSTHVRRLAVVAALAVWGACSESPVTAPEGLGGLDLAGGKSGPRASGPASTAPALRFSAKDIRAVDVSGVKVLLYHSDEGGAQSLHDNLVATGQLGDSDIDISAAMFSGTPTSLATLLEYACVIAWTNSSPVNPVAHGNRLKEYADGGGRVVLSTYALTAPSNAWELQGGIMGNGYNPLDLTETDLTAFPRSLDFDTALTGHPFLDGVSNFTYGGNANYVTTTLDPGATLIGSDNLSVPLIAVNSAGNVAAINLYPGGAFAPSTGVYRTYANACAGGGVTCKQRLQGLRVAVNPLGDPRSSILKFFINRALKQLNGGNTEGASDTLEAFILTVRGMALGGILTNAKKIEFIEEAEACLDELSV